MTEQTTETAPKTFDWTAVPNRATPETTYNIVAPYGLFGDWGPWYEVVEDTGEQEDWKLVLREYNPDTGETLPTQYTITHETVIKVMFEIAMNSDYDLDVRAKYLGLLVDPDKWDTEFDVEDADAILQRATWGWSKYS